MINDNSKANSILVLGGNGYLGSKVTRRLISEGYENIICVKRKKSDLSRLRDIEEKICWIPASVDAIETALLYNRFECVINMVCDYGRGTLLYDNVIESNIDFPLKVLNKTVEMGTKRYITIGTGLPDSLGMYSFSKKMFSEFGRFYVEKFGINFVNIQLEMLYGPDEPLERFIPSMINHMINGTDVYTTIGTQKRDIIAIDDVVNAIITIFHSKGKGYQDIPVGTGVAPTISELIDYIWTLTGKLSKVHKGAVPLRNDEPDCVADTNIIASICDWNPIFWKDGIREMVEKMRRNN